MTDKYGEADPITREVSPEVACPLGGLCVQACEGPVEVLVNGFISFTPAGNSFAGDTKKICQRDGKYEGEYPPVDSWL